MTEKKQPSAEKPAAANKKLSLPEPGVSARKPSAQAGARLGLALGGGVARGWAHIGALRRLEEIGVAPDILAGTSVGALVGGFWLAGELDALEDWARSLSPARMLTYVDVVLNGAGLMGGKRLERAMIKNLPSTDIRDLPRDYVAVTAELATGHEVWLREGDLAEAMQAAYALPGVFPPRAIDGRWLIDGALVNPLPVSACRALGARVVIAIGLHADAFNLGVAQRRARFGEMHPEIDAEKAGKAGWGKLFQGTAAAPGVGSVMLASFNILMDRVTRSRLAGEPPDVLITPQVGHISLLEFDKAGELIDLGREAIDDSRAQIESALEYLG